MKCIIHTISVLWWVEETARGWEIKTHDFKGSSLLVQCCSDLIIWFLNQWSESWIGPCLIVWGGPQSWNWWFLSNHLVFELCISNCSCQIISENWAQVSMIASNIGETPCQINISIMLDKISNSQEKCCKCILNNINSKHGSSSNWNWVGVNASIPLLVNWMLTFGWWDFFLSWVSGQMSLEWLINNKHWFQMVNVFSFLSLSEDINLWVNILLSMNLWQLSLNIECKASKFLNVNRSSSSDIVTDVFNQGFPDNNELCLWLKWFQVCWGSLCRLIMLSWILVSVS